MIIALEWIPGWGKSTLVEWFIKYCKKNWKTVYHHKPFLRRDIIAILTKYITTEWTIKLHKIAKPIKELINEKLLISLNIKYDIVIIDRFLESIGWIIFAYCYPRLCMKQVREFMKNIYSLNEYRSVILDISMELWMKRSEKRRWKTYDNNMQLLFYRMVDYTKYNWSEENLNISYIDGSKSIKTVLNNFISFYEGF